MYQSIRLLMLYHTLMPPHICLLTCNQALTSRIQHATRQPPSAAFLKFSNLVRLALNLKPSHLVSALVSHGHSNGWSNGLCQ
jgi:hypothetical protein